MEFIDDQAIEDTTYDEDVDHLIGDEVIPIIPPNQPRWAELNEQDLNDLVTKDILDGVVIVSDTMKIAKIPGVMRILSRPLVSTKGFMELKGFDDYFPQNTRHIYELPLGFCCNSRLSAILATGPIINHERPDLKQLIAKYHQTIRESVLELPDGSKTKQEILQRADGVICIYKEDFATLSDLLSRTLEQIHPDEFGFAINVSFYWSISQLGQSLEYSSHNLPDLQSYDATFNLIGNYRIAIHCAKDYSLEDHAMFWVAEHVAAMWQGRPDEVFYPALIPGLANLLYTCNGLDDRSLSKVQYYTKVFAPAHRDRTELFVSGKITNMLFDRYIRMHHGDCNKYTTAKQKKLATILNQFSLLGDRCTNLHESCRGSTVARLEIVWTTEDNFASVEDVIKEAFNHTAANAFPYFFHQNMLTKVSACQLEERVSLWTKTFGGVLNHLADSILLLRKEKNGLWGVDLTKLLEPELFYKCRVAEVILHSMLTGRMRGSCPISLQRYLGLIDSSFAIPNPDLQSTIWPFEGIIQNENFNFSFANFEEIKSKIPKLSYSVTQTRICTRFLDERVKLNRTRTSSTAYPIERIQEIANVAVDAIVIFQLNQPHITGRKYLRDGFRENIDPKHQIKHTTIEGIIKLLKKKRKDSTRFKFFPIIYRKLEEEIGENDVVLRLLTNRISHLITEEGYPLRITIRNNDYLAVSSEAATTEYPLNDNLKRAWIRSLVTMNHGRTPSVAGACLHKLIMKFFCEADRTNITDLDLALIAKNIQRLFDQNEVFDVFSNRYGDFLLSEWRNDKIDLLEDDIPLAVSVRNAIAARRRRRTEQISTRPISVKRPRSQSPVENVDDEEITREEVTDLLSQASGSLSMNSQPVVPSQAQVNSDSNVEENLNVGIDRAALQRLQRQKRYSLRQLKK